MKNIVLIFLHLFFTFILHAQNKPVVITYGIAMNLNMPNPGVRTLTGQLSIADGKSMYGTKTYENYKPVENDTMMFKRAKDFQSFIIKDYNNKKSFFQGNSPFLKDKNAYYTDTLYPMKWTVTGISKKIDQYTCFKAFSIFRGRAYSAWFTPDLAFSEGPWKFGGLPGLIMELYDEEKAIYYKFISLEYKTVAPIQIPENKGNFIVFKTELKRAIKKMEEQISGGEKVDPTCLDCSSTAKIKLATIENILEE